MKKRKIFSVKKEHNQTRLFGLINAENDTYKLPFFDAIQNNENDGDPFCDEDNF